MTLTEATHRARAHFAGVAVLLGALAVAAEPGQAPALLGMVLAVSLLLIAAMHLLVPAGIAGVDVRPHRARAPDVILQSTHPDAPGHPRPRAPGTGAVALV